MTYLGLGCPVRSGGVSTRRPAGVPRFHGVPQTVMSLLVLLVVTTGCQPTSSTVATKSVSHASDDADVSSNADSRAAVEIRTNGGTDGSSTGSELSGDNTADPHVVENDPTAVAPPTVNASPTTTVPATTDVPPTTGAPATVDVPPTTDALLTTDAPATTAAPSVQRPDMRVLTGDAPPVPPSRPRLARRIGGKLNLSFDDLEFPIQPDQDFERSMMTASIEEMDGKQVIIRGFILGASVYEHTGITEFVLVRDNLQCCFGPTAYIYHNIQVDMEAGATATYSERPVAVTGKLTIKPWFAPNKKCYSVYHISATSVK